MSGRTFAQLVCRKLHILHIIIFTIISAFIFSFHSLPSFNIALLSSLYSRKLTISIFFRKISMLLALFHMTVISIRISKPPCASGDLLGFGSLTFPEIIDPFCEAYHIYLDISMLARDMTHNRRSNLSGQHTFCRNSKLGVRLN